MFQSFFGRSYNNLAQISECKNSGDCVINKKNRTACKACRLKKCLLVGMSKSGSRYGRRSNWFKIHCLLQEQQAKQNTSPQPNCLVNSPVSNPQQRTPPPPTHHQNLGFNLIAATQQYQHSTMGLHHLPRTKEELMLLSLDETYKHVSSPSVSSPESHNSDSSAEDVRRLPIFPALLPPHLFPPPGLIFPTPYPGLYPGLLQTVTSNNNNRMIRNNNNADVSIHKRIFLDAVLKSQRTPTPPEMRTSKLNIQEEEEETVLSNSPQEDPIDLSMKSERGSSPASSIRSNDSTERGAGSEADEEDCDSDREIKRLKILRPTPLDLTTKV